jgi:mono/diheme cytochrome c family protein
VTRLAFALVLTVTVLGLAACEDEGYEPPDAAQRIELADSLYSPTLFDTIDWSSDRERIVAGNLVYADYCRRCHGTIGEGGVVQAAGNTFVVPSLVQAEWGLDDSMTDVRRSVFTGHTGGMPSWGISRLTPRQIDAVAFYILEQLRPEILDRDEDAAHFP